MTLKPMLMMNSTQTNRERSTSRPSVAYFSVGADQILDCGCGTGIFLEKVAGSVQFAVGVVSSSKMLERAKLRLGQISNVELVCADIDFPPFSEGTFRHVFMFTVLPSVHTYWGNTMHESLRVLRTHGIMTLSVLKKETSSKKVLTKLSINLVLVSCGSSMAPHFRINVS